jgi:hypothetical protein
LIEYRQISGRVEMSWTRPPDTEIEDWNVQPASQQGGKGFRRKPSEGLRTSDERQVAPERVHGRSPVTLCPQTSDLMELIVKARSSVKILVVAPHVTPFAEPMVSKFRGLRLGVDNYVENDRESLVRQVAVRAPLLLVAAVDSNVDQNL